MKKIQVNTVEATSEVVPLTNQRMLLEIRIRNCPDSIMPPKTMAERMSQMVLSMPAMPRVASSLVTMGLEVGISTGPNMAFMLAIQAILAKLPPLSATWRTAWGWKIRAKTTPSSTPVSSAGTAGTLRMMM